MKKTKTPPPPKPGNGRPYSLAYTAAGTPRRYLLSGIPAQLWINVRAQAKREHLAVRQVILQLLEGWLATRDTRSEAAARLQTARAVIAPETRRALARKAEETAKRQARR